ncbi:MAG: APC family permease [Firmicutes bacterium]|nr:APC family permease [Bacillota bacterium]
MPAPSRQFLARVHRFFYGRPKRTDQQHRERLGIPAALAVFSADAISSVAYATEEILWVLIAAGTAATAYSLPVGLGIVALVWIVATSYNQTIHAYPSGGGSYIVSKDNLGTTAGLVAGAALLVDYVLTVAVSTASGIAAVTSAFPAFYGHEVVLGLVAIWFIAWMNLRGVRESGAMFSVPIYAFMVSVFLMIAIGFYRAAHGLWHPPVSPLAGFGLGNAAFRQATADVTLFMVLRAFASGCTALTGIEAISNGVQAFKAPEPENAVKTLRLARTILYTMFAGITLLAFGFHALPKPDETILSQIAHEIFGSGFMYYAVQITTAAILLLAANTAYADFPRLVGMVARDGFLPRKLANRGDTLVFNGGIILLAGLASALIVLFRGSVHLLIPLYAVGVFLAFTMSQSGMVVHWLKRAKATGVRPRWSIFINGLGAFLSGVVLVVIAMTKFLHGAWIVTIVIPILVGYFFYVHQYYRRFRARVESLLDEHMALDDASKVRVVLTIGGLSPVIDHSMKVARRISKDITAVYVAVEPEEGERIRRKWDVRRHGGVQLTVIPSAYRTVVEPLHRFLAKMQEEDPGTLINLLVPVIVTNEAFDSYLHNGTADQILRELRFTEGVIITVIPFYVNMHDAEEGVIAHEAAPTED